LSTQPFPTIAAFQRFSFPLNTNHFKMADLNLQEIHDFMISIAKKVGDRIVSATPTTEAAGSKKNCTPLPLNLLLLQC
jgi:hypothetical protein